MAIRNCPQASTDDKGGRVCVCVCVCVYTCIHIGSARSHRTPATDGRTFDVILYMLSLKPSAPPVCHFFECCDTHTHTHTQTQTHTHISRTGVTTGIPPHVHTSPQISAVRAVERALRARDRVTCRHAHARVRGEYILIDT